MAQSFRDIGLGENGPRHLVLHYPDDWEIGTTWTHDGRPTYRAKRVTNRAYAKSQPDASSDLNPKVHNPGDAMTIVCLLDPTEPTSGTEDILLVSMAGIQGVTDGNPLDTLHMYYQPNAVGTDTLRYKYGEVSIGEEKANRTITFSSGSYAHVLVGVSVRNAADIVTMEYWFFEPGIPLAEQVSEFSAGSVQPSTSFNHLYVGGTGALIPHNSVLALGRVMVFDYYIPSKQFGGLMDNT